MMKLDKRKIDVTQVFLTFTALVGDVAKTAAALDLDPQVVEQLAKDEGWHEKLQRVCLMSKSGKPGDWERAQNRALCFVQGHRLRSMLDGILLHFQGMEPAEIVSQLTVASKSGTHISARFLADLAAAAEKAHGLTYAALGDTAGERSHRDSPDEELNASALHAAVISALSAQSTKSVSADVLVRELSDSQQAVVRQIVTPADVPAPERTGAEPDRADTGQPQVEVG